MNRLIAFLVVFIFSTGLSFGQQDTVFFKRVTKDSSADLSSAIYLPEFKKLFGSGDSPVNRLDPVGWTNDFAHILTSEQALALDSMISKFELETTIEIAVVTLDSAFNNKEIFDDYISGLHRLWGVGKKIRHNGILIGISNRLRKIRISNGYGISGRLTDADTKAIIDGIILPEFKKADYYNGLLKGITAMMDKLK